MTDATESRRWRHECAGEPKNPPGWSAWRGHHFYWAFILQAIGFLNIFYGSLWVAVPCFTIGLHWGIDDFIQHVHQGYNLPGWPKDPNYVSPVHRWYWAVVTYALQFAPDGTWIWKALMWLRRY